MSRIPQTGMTASDHLNQARGAHYDSLTLAACVIGELGAVFNALSLMGKTHGSDDDIRRLIGIGQDIACRWTTDFEQEAEKVKDAFAPTGDAAAQRKGNAA